MNKKTPQKHPKTKKVKIPRTDSESSDYVTEIVDKSQVQEKTGLDFQQIQEALDEALKKSKKTK